jgi:hypothetical protein
MLKNVGLLPPLLNVMHFLWRVILIHADPEKIKKVKRKVGLLCCGEIFTNQNNCRSTK